MCDSELCLKPSLNQETDKELLEELAADMNTIKNSTKSPKKGLACSTCPKDDDNDNEMEVEEEGDEEDEDYEPEEEEEEEEEEGEEDQEEIDAAEVLEGLKDLSQKSASVGHIYGLRDAMLVTSITSGIVTISLQMALYFASSLF